MAIPETYRTPHGLSDQLREEVSAVARLTLGTINPDGSPHLTFVLYSWDDSDRLLVPTPHTTRKIKNVRERGSVTALIGVASGWVSCYGAAEVIEGAMAQELNQSVRERLLTERGMASMGVFLAAHEDSTIRVTPRKWLSWSHDVIDPWMEANGIDTSDQDEWWKDLTTHGK
ncbi:MAG: pyridoxamine 5'-phosphate oxidase family protein [Acidimicrobiia bacterium]